MARSDWIVTILILAVDRNDEFFVDLPPLSLIVDLGLFQDE